MRQAQVRVALPPMALPARAASGGAPAPHTTTFRNPLDRAEGSDPWLVFHEGRTTRAQRVSWKADGTPDFGVPVPLDEELPGPSGE